MCGCSEKQIEEPQKEIKNKLELFSESVNEQNIANICGFEISTIEKEVTIIPNETTILEFTISNITIDENDWPPPNFIKFFIAAPDEERYSEIKKDILQMYKANQRNVSIYDFADETILSNNESGLIHVRDGKYAYQPSSHIMGCKSNEKLLEFAKIILDFRENNIDNE